MNKENVASFLYRRIVLPSTAPFCEQTHDATFLLLEYLQRSDVFLKLLRREFQLNDERLRVNALGIEFPSPFLLAAGIDKDARAVSALATFGPGGTEVGSFTWQARRGNPQVREEILTSGRVITVKRIERFPDGTVINCMGFPSMGTARTVENLKASREKTAVPVGVSIAVSPGLKNETEKMMDLGSSLKLIYPIKPVWMTLNISCPNGDDRSVREKVMEESLMLVANFARQTESLEDELEFKVPRLVKIGPDMKLGEIETLVETIKELNYDGIVATNTTIDRTGSRAKYAHIKRGGLSGPLLFEKSLETVRQVRQCDRELGGKPLVIMGCGGINSLERFHQMKEAGADVCQILSAFPCGGPYLFRKLNRDYLDYISD